jgi:hypothetical protein
MNPPTTLHGKPLVLALALHYVAQGGERHGRAYRLPMPTVPSKAERHREE